MDSPKDQSLVLIDETTGLVKVAREQEAPRVCRYRIHIISLSLTKFKGRGTIETAKLTTWKALLYMFSGFEDVLNVSSINELCNEIRHLPLCCVTGHAPLST